MIVVALHGFFGTPNDWDIALESLDSNLEVELVTPDLAVWATRAGMTDFETFAASFNRSVKILSEEREEAVVIAGYSLGARLAAHCLLDAPELYRAALLISMNPGLPQNDLTLRRERLGFDQGWAHRMRRDEWEITWQAWNEQSVLQPGTRVRGQAEVRERALADLSRKIEGRREAWARAMETWSLGHQADLRSELLEWATEDGHRLTLMTGTDDVKFTELTTNWLQKAEQEVFGGSTPETVRHRKVLGAGHRILYETPEDVVSELSQLVLGS